MARVLLIDDEPIYYKIISHALKPLGYEVEHAKTGMEGLVSIQTNAPDVVITDVVLPDVSGYEIAQRLRRDPRFKTLPIIFLTSQADLSNKLKAFEVGADDYISKPFQPEELVARLGILVRRSEALKAARNTEAPLSQTGTVITVHSLRGGVGCSSMAVNLAVALNQLWGKPTLLVDTVLNAGQVALMLNASPTHSWADFSDLSLADIENEVIEQVISQHSSGLHYIAVPSYPLASDSFTEEFWQFIIRKLREMYAFIIVDTAHDFSNVTIQMLDAADYVVMMLAPEMASIRAAVCATNIYDKLAYTGTKILPVINHIFPQAGIKQSQIEKVLKRSIDLTIPHVPNEFTKAINFGEPMITNNLDSPVTSLFEDTAYRLSGDYHKNIPPAAPSASWKRVTSRLTGQKVK